MRRRQVFSREFKLEAIRVLEEGKKPAADIARELGIRRNQLYKWKEQRDKQRGAVFPRPGKRSNKSSESEEIVRLKSELAGPKRRRKEDRGRFSDNTV